MLSNAQTAATLAVSDIDRARKFYSDTLGFSIANDSAGGVLFRSGEGSAFFVYPSEFAGTNKATAMSINVEDLEATAESLREKGIAFIDYDQPGFKTENGIAHTPEGPVAWFEDPDGNILALTQMPTG